MSWISDRIIQLQSAFASFIPGIEYSAYTKDRPADNLSTLKVVELKALAKERGFKGYTGLRKAELVKMLQEN